MDITDIIEAIRKNQVRISDHADEEAQADRLKFDEIYFSVLYGEIIEDYQSGKPYPSCLISARPSTVILSIAFGPTMSRLAGPF